MSCAILKYSYPYVVLLKSSVCVCVYRPVYSGDNPPAVEVCCRALLLVVPFSVFFGTTTV